MDSSDGLNVGDVTGPRWAGGTRNPETMPEADATPDEAFDLGTVAGYDEGFASRDAEVEVLVKDRDSWKRLWERLDSTSEKHYENLIQDRIDAEDALTAEVAALREQLAAAEARAVRAELEWAQADARTALAEAVIEAALARAALMKAPSSVLAAVKADAWDEGARYVTADSTYTEMFDIPANPYRSGTEGSNQ